MSNREAPFLHFYGKHGIIPTHLEVPDIAKFYLIRDQLFETIGVASSLIKGCDILEIGPGSGEKQHTFSLNHQKVIPPLKVIRQVQWQSRTYF